MKDIVAGGLVFVVGAFALVEALDQGTGSAAAMRAGYFPAGLGVLAMVIGLGILAPAIGRRRPPRSPGSAVAWRPLLAVVAGLSAFAFVIDLCGMLPAIAAVIGLSALGTREVRLLSTLVLVVAACIGAWLVIIVGLGVPIPLIRWSG